MANRTKIIHALALLLGLMLFVWLIYSIGATAILASIKAVGFGFVVLILVSGVRHFLRAAAWWNCFEAGERRFKLFELFNVRLAGEAIRYVSFTGPLFGEPAKAALMRRHTPMVQGLSSVVVENLTYTFSAVLVTISGLILLLANFTIHRNIKVAAIVVCLFVAAVIFVIQYHIRRRSFAFTRLMKRLEHSGVGNKEWFQRKAVGIESMEANVYNFYNHRGHSFTRVLSLQLAAHLMNIFEVYLILRFMNLDATFIIAFIIEAMMKIINFVFFFVPGQVGVFEGGNALLLAALGLGATAGVALALVEKIRTLAWTAYGLVVLAFIFRKDSKPSPTVAAFDTGEIAEVEMSIQGTAS